MTWQQYTNADLKTFEGEEEYGHWDRIIIVTNICILIH